MLLSQRNTTRWEPKSFRQTHGAYLRIDCPRLDFATKYRQKYRTSSSGCFIRRWNSEFALVYKLLYLVIHTFGHTLLQSPVWGDSYVSTYRESDENILVLTWWFRCVSGIRISYVALILEDCKSKNNNWPSSEWGHLLDEMLAGCKGKRVHKHPLHRDPIWPSIVSRSLCFLLCHFI